MQLEKIDGLNVRRRAYVRTVETGIESIRGLEPSGIHEGAEPGGFYGFACHYDQKGMSGLAKQQFVDALQQEGLAAAGGTYPLLHTLPIFAEGFDIFIRGRGSLCTRQMGGDDQGYQAGDFPVSEKACADLVLLPVLSDPIEGAAEQIIAAIGKVAEHAEGLEPLG